MIAKVYKTDDIVYNPATAEFFVVKPNHSVVAWEFERVDKEPLPVLAIGIPFTNPLAADEAAMRLTDLGLDTTLQE